MAKSTKEDTNPVSWLEFDELIDELLNKINRYFQKKDESINVITPLLRTGGIIGGVVGIKMRILLTLPVQFKYSYNPTKINQILSIPDILTDIPEPMNILLCEGNTSSGLISKQAAVAIKEKYPQAKIYLATLTKVYGGPEELEDIEEIFFGRMTDENFQATEEEKINHNLRSGITIFPWESVDDELSDINAM